MKLARQQRYLLDHSTGILKADEIYYNINYVLDKSGHPISPVSRNILETPDCVLFIPDESTGSMELLVTPEEIDFDCAATDRWRIYHGKVEESHMARLYVEAGKLDNDVHDEIGIVVENPLAADEPVLCKMYNKQHRDNLADLCKVYAKIAVTDPVMVGIDPAGINIRASFGIIRVPLLRETSNVQQVKKIITQMMQSANREGNS